MTTRLDTPVMAPLDEADDRARLARFGGRGIAEANRRMTHYIALLDAHQGEITDAVRAECLEAVR